MSENKPPSIVPVRTVFTGTLNLPTHLISPSLYIFHTIYHLRGAIIIIIIINTTRWSCRADATKALSQEYGKFMEALDQIDDDTDELADVRCKARGLSERMCQLETGIYTVFWNDILERANATRPARYCRIPS